ncbi:MAG: DUF839 domain-containing protein [Deltaproteobacteria bacterium]|nr:DUF839 domain-containing protein [Deltaproteobacteria bacterium]
MKIASRVLAVMFTSAALMSFLVGEGLGQVDPKAPLSAVVAIGREKGGDVTTFVKKKVEDFAFGELDGFPLPLEPGADAELVRTMKGLRSNVVVKWFDPLTTDTSPSAPRFGANNDYVAYFGDGWDKNWKGSDIPGSAPQFNGSGKSGWLWVNHEYVSNDLPAATSAPTGQHLSLAKHLFGLGILNNDVTADVWTQTDLDTFTRNYKRQLGGSWLKITKDSSGNWSVDRGARALRYDSTSSTLSRITGYQTVLPDQDDTGTPLPAGVVAGIAGDCSGAQTPWGTIITAEENVQDYYGDLETAWDNNQKFVAGKGFDPGSNITFTNEASAASEFGRISDPNGRHNRDTLGYLVEIDPGTAPDKFYNSVKAGGDGKGHRKLGAVGRARWENATFVTDDKWELIPSQPIVMYAANDRRSGRFYKFVTKEVYRKGMSRGEIRALLDEGALYVAHFAGLDNRNGNTIISGSTSVAPTETARGSGRWIHLSVTSKDVAPNASALGSASKTVGDALRDVSWNGIGGFPTDDDVRRALFTAEAKIGVMELNRPEDLEWNPRDPSGTPRLYIAFTNHTGGTQLDQSGKLLKADVTDRRNDGNGGIWALQESTPDTPAGSKTFSFFQVAKGANGGRDNFEFAAPDNIMIDRKGGVWFGTDGNFGRTSGKAADCLYYLDLDLSHREGPMLFNVTFGKAFRVACVPSDAEVTGPAFSSDQETIFLAVQHPGEDLKNVSTFPQPR